jgi:pyruvate/2-oxoglutarate dehydrogenase complex dihydrolipoamide dehydrogenase (E3) component
MVEAAPTLLPGADPEIGEALHELLEGEGIEIVCGAEVERAWTGPDGRPRIAFTAAGAARELAGDALLLGAGRGPSVESLRLEAAGVEGGPKGIPVDARLRTSQEGHYAAGDVLGGPFGAYTHVARQLGRDAAENALDLGAHDVSRDQGPRAIFSDPEFATVGMTEKEARRAGHDVGVGLTRFSGGKARAWGQERGLVKVVADRASRRILGAHVLAYHAADLVHPVVVAMRSGSADPLLGAFHIHPTLGEPVQGAARSALA